MADAHSTTAFTEQLPPHLGRDLELADRHEARHSPARRLIVRIALCAVAIAGGVVLARLTNFGRPAPAEASADLPRSVRVQAPPEDTSPPPAEVEDDTPPDPGATPPPSAAPIVSMPDRIDVTEADGPRGLGERYKNGLVMTGATHHRLILFTFDDGPDRELTPKLLDELDAAHVKAVFFLLGNRIRGDNKWQRQQAAVAREIVRRGHIVGSHTMDHPQLPLLDNAGVDKELVDTEHVFEHVLGARPWLIRPPGGALSPRVDRLLADRGYTTVLWNLGAGDFEVHTADEVVETWKKVFERREREDGDRGGIVLLHDIHPWSVAAFPRIVAEIRRRNCTLLARGEELYDIVDDPSFFFVPRGNAPPGTPAPAANPDPTVLAARQARLRIETAQRCAQLAER